MPRNNIQFQKGLSLSLFQAQYGTEEQCRKALFRTRWPLGYRFPQCGHRQFYELRVRPVYQCCACRHQHSLISNTIFTASKLPLTLCFLTIYLITHSKEGMAALSMARTLGISNNAASRIKSKIQMVMKRADDATPLSQLAQFDDAYWGGKRQGCKRGRGAAGKTHMLAAVSRNGKGHPIHIRFSRGAGFSSSEVARWLRCHLAPTSVVLSDGLTCFNGFSQEGHHHWYVITGGGKNPKTSKFFKWINSIIGNVKNALRGTYHAIDHRHLPRYLAEFWYRFNR